MPRTTPSRARRDRHRRQGGDLGHDDVGTAELGVVEGGVGPAAWRSTRRGCPARRSGPSSITRIRSASRIVDSRWAITKTGPVGAQRRHGVLEQQLGAGVDGAGGLVEDQQGRVGEEGPGDRDQLLLAGADVGAFVVDDGVVAVGEAVDEAVDERGPGRLDGSRPRWRRAGRRRCCRGSCPRTARCPGAPSRSRSEGPRDACAAMSTPSRVMRPPSSS